MSTEQRRDDHGTKREIDPLLSRELLRSRVTGYTAGQDAALDITLRVPHVFQPYHPILDEAAVALDRAEQLLSAESAFGPDLKRDRRVRRRRRHRPVPGPRPPLFVTGQAIVMNGGPVS